MCPRTFYLQVFIILAIWLMVYSYRRQIERARLNADIIKSFLKAPEMRLGFLNINFTLEGWYKDRKISYFYHLDSECNGSKYNLYITPKYAPIENRLFLLKYPRPTKNTYLKKDKIFYSKWTPLRGGLFNPGGMVLFTAEEIGGILEELTLAAEQVEKSANIITG